MIKPSFLSPKVVLRPSPLAGKGLFAVEPIARGELVLMYSAEKGEFVPTERALAFASEAFDYGIQVDDDLFLSATGTDELEDADFVNHSCEPNCGIDGSVRLVAMRDIAEGEEITFDYAMSESAEYRMACACGAPSCRKAVTGEDWKRPELQNRYHGYFSDYLARKMSR